MRAAAPTSSYAPLLLREGVGERGNERQLVIDPLPQGEGEDLARQSGNTGPGI
jgi:hypothetical protein